MKSNGKTTYNLNNYKTRIIIVITACILFLLVLLSPLFVKILGSKKIKQKYLVLPIETNNIVYTIEVLDERIIQYLNLLEISGWAFIDGKSAEGNKIYIVLKSDNNTYVFNSNSRERHDVTANFKTLNLDDSGFMTAIPWNLIEDGKYKIGFYIKNGNDEALQYTDKIISKSSYGIFPFKISQPLDIRLPEEPSSVIYSIDSIAASKYKRHQFISINGWAHIEGYHSVGDKIYIVVKSDKKMYVFDTVMQKRPDVTAYFRSLNYDDSGFSAMIPGKSLEKGS